MWKLIYPLFILIRLIGFVLIFIEPPWGWLIAYLADLWDYYPSVKFGLSRGSYLKIDKTLDLLFRLVLFAYAYINAWQVLFLFLILILYRSLGDFFFIITKQDRYYIYFPNFIDFYFPIFYVLFTYFPYRDSIVDLLLIVAASILKLAHENQLHKPGVNDPAAFTTT
ncbi:MAG TPA: hypothetical protein VJC17_04225 [Candidatus Dojkabacteria bacterium]|nr:hypothetical protein [Candidatus Dojkabacteria bacterium]